MNTEFPEWFHRYNAHMFLIKNSDVEYRLYPPNQRDWSYTLSKVEESWHVIGVKIDLNKEVVHDIYEWIEGDWILSKTIQEKN